jgi:hypothetical protein
MDKFDVEFCEKVFNAKQKKNKKNKKIQKKKEKNEIFSNSKNPEKFKILITDAKRLLYLSEGQSNIYLNRKRLVDNLKLKALTIIKYAQEIYKSSDFIEKNIIYNKYKKIIDTQYNIKNITNIINE